MVDSPRQPGLVHVLDLLDRFGGIVRVLAASLRAPADLLLHPLLVLPLIVVAVDVSLTIAGMVATAATMAWLLPQLFVHRAGYRPWLVAGRAGAAVTLAIISTLVGGAGLFGPLLVIVAVYWAIGGLLAAGNLEGALERPADGSTTDHVVLLVGGALAVVTGLVAGGALGPTGAPFPGWLVQFALGAAVMLGLAAALTWRDGTDVEPGAPPWSAAGMAMALLVHGRRPRRYLIFRIILALAALADPFLVITGLRAFDITPQSIGIVLALFALVHLATTVGLPRLMDAGHARLLAQLVALVRVLIPVLALSIPIIWSATPLATRLPAGSAWMVPAAWLGLALLLSLAVAITTATDTAYLADALAPGHRLAMRGLLVVSLAVGSLAYIGGGFVAEAWGLDRLWLVAAALGILGLLASGVLLDVPPADTRDLTDTGALPTFREPFDSS